MSNKEKTFVQWKGTHLCMDFYCPDCDGASHFDGYFAYNIKCPHCGVYYEMPQDLKIKKTNSPKLPYLEGEKH